MKLPLQKFLSSKWQGGITLVALFLLLTVGSVLAEAPTVQLRPLAPGWIAVDWQHPLDNAGGATLEIEYPPRREGVELNGTYTITHLQASTVYRFRVCAHYGTTPDCSEWLAAQTLASTEPPPTGKPVPNFTSHSATPTSITVYWTPSASYSYDFYQIMYGRNGQPGGQDPKHWRCCSYTANGLSPGTYHFIIQGCIDTYFGFDTSCSKFSAPFEVATSAPPPPPPTRRVIYGITDNGELKWYRHVGQEDGSFRWEGPKNVGTGWGGECQTNIPRLNDLRQVSMGSARLKVRGPIVVSKGRGNLCEFMVRVSTDLLEPVASLEEIEGSAVFLPN